MFLPQLFIKYYNYLFLFIILYFVLILIEYSINFLFLTIIRGPHTASEAIDNDIEIPKAV